MKYTEAPDLQERLEHIVETLDMTSIDIERVACIRSEGTSTRRTIARCHGLPKIVQLGLKTKAFYTIEFITEKFDKLKKEDQDEVIIHELMHIPKNFGGGFRHHDYVCDKSVRQMHENYKNKINPKKESVLDALISSIKSMKE